MVDAIIARAIAIVLSAISALLGGHPPDSPPSVVDTTFGLPLMEVQLLAEITGSSPGESSGVAIDEDRNQLVIVDDSGLLLRHELRADGSLGRQLEVLDISDVAGDPEGVTWVSETIYALADEDRGTIVLVDLADVAATRLERRAVLETIATGLGEADGNGLEGVAFDPRSSVDDPVFYAVYERPPTLLRVTRAGVDALPIPGIVDASDVAVSGDSIAVVSDESRLLVHLAVDATFSQIRVVATQDLEFDAGAFGQAEGVVVARDGRTYVVGEADGLVFGFFTAAGA